MPKPPPTIISPADLEERAETPRPSKFDRVFEAASAIALEDAWESDSVGFINRVMVQATLPYKEPKPRPGETQPPPVWGRRCGKVSLVIQPLSYLVEIVDAKGNVIGTEPRSLGYPFGGIPRLVLAWIGREVRRNKSQSGRELYLGNSFAQFMRDLGIYQSSGGPTGTNRRVKKQVQRLFTARMALVVGGEPDGSSSPQMFSADTMAIADKTQLWWEPRALSETGSFETSVALSELFYKEVAEHSVPVDMRALAALKASPFELDLYCWLTYRFSYLRKSTVVPWDQLRQQFGSEEKNIRKFRSNVIESLRAVKAVYPDAKVDPDQDSRGLLLQPSLTSVRKYIKTTD